MEVVIGILVLGALVGALYLLQSGVSRGITIASGAVTGNTRKRGLAALRICRPTSLLPCPGGTSSRESGTRLNWERRRRRDSNSGGSQKMAPSSSSNRPKGWTNHLQFIVDTETDEAGCTGRAAAGKWIESDGQITTTENIERIHKHVRSAVEQFGGTYSESSSE